LVSQTKRHSFISALLGIPRFVIAVNKMDLVDYSETVYENIRRDYTEFASKLAVKDVRFIPISALNGDNVVTHSAAMPWYHGETVMEYLENVYVGGDGNLVDFRFPVQLVLRPNQDYRGYAGKVASGEIRVGEEVLALPSKRRTRVVSLDQYSRKPNSKPLQVATAPMSITITLEDDIDIARGDVLVRPGNQPHACNHFEAMLVWTGDTPMDQSKRYLVQHTTRQVKASIDSVRYRVDVNTLSRLDSAPLGASEIGRVTISTGAPLFLDPYRVNRATGNFILIDPDTFQTAGAGMVIDRVSHESDEALVSTATQHALHSEHGLVTSAERIDRAGIEPLTYWFTGLSGSGKSSIAVALERALFDQGRAVYRLDGDNIRNGLSSDLGFSPQDRCENIRRVAEVAKLFNAAGVTVICSLISPLAEDRLRAREIIGEGAFREIYLSTPIGVCEERDPHGLYKKARAGKIPQFTGVSAPYEVPQSPELVIDTGSCSIEAALLEILEKIQGAR